MNSPLSVFKYLFLITISFACVSDLNDATNFSNAKVKVENVELALPAAKATLAIKDLVTDIDTANITFGAETPFGRQIIINYKDTIISRGISNIARVPDKTISRSIPIPPIAIPNLNTASTLTLGSILAGSPGDGLPFIRFTLPDITRDLPLATGAQFEFIEFETGEMELTVNNNTEGVLSFTYEIRNKSDNSLIGSATFANIPAKGSQVRTIDLKAKILRKSLKFVLKSFSNTSTVGTIRYTDNITFNLNFKNLKYKRIALRFNRALNFTQLDTINLDQSGVDIWRIIFKAGSLTYQLNSNLPAGLSGTIKLTLPDFKLSGSPIEENINFRSGRLAAGTIALDGADADLTNYTPPHSRFGIRLEVAIAASDPTKVLEFSNANNFDIKFGTKNFTYSFFEGVIQKQRIPLENADLNFTLIDSTLNTASIKLNQVVMNLEVSNGYGVESQLQIDRLRFQNKSGQNLDMIVSPNPAIIAAGNPTITQTNSKVTKLNVDNSADIANLAPNKLNYDFDITVNPNSSAFKMAFNDKSKVDVFLEVGIVLAGSVKGLSRTLDFKSDFGNLKSKVDKVNSTSIRIFSDNTLPVDLNLQVLLLDEGDKVTDSLFSKGNERIIKAGVTDGSGAVTASTVTTLDIPIDLDKLANSKKIRLRVSADTENDGTKSVIFYDRNKVILEVGFRVKGSVLQKL